LSRPLTHLEAQLQAAIETFARPRLSLAGFGAIAMSAAAARAWDAAHPVEAAERARLVEELESETRRAEREWAEAEAADRALRRAGVRLEASGVGERSLAAALEARETEALAVVRRWLPRKNETWLALCGEKRCGKTVAATWAVREVIRGGDTAAFRRASELSKLSQFDAGAAELDYLKRVHLLVLDDFGTELLNDYARAQFHELLDARHEAYGRTILTSNLAWLPKGSQPGFAQRLGERLAARVREAGCAVQLAAMKGKS